jgi:methionyl-tRNA formyltransferase
MNKTSETVIFFGNERIATGVNTQAPTLRGLIEAGYNVAAVVSNYEPARSRKSRDLEIKKIAEQYNIRVLLPSTLSEIADELKSYGASVGVLVAFGKIVPQSVIDIFPKGIINIHPSLLPSHRGPIPIESVMLKGTDKTGVSLMQLAKTMDTGPVYGQAELLLKGQETKQQLADELLEIGKTMLIDLLPDILNGSIVALPQDDSRATYDTKLTKEDGLIDWQKSAVQIEREVRAFKEWPNSRTNLAGKDVIITKSIVLPLEGTPGETTTVDKNIVVFCGKDALVIEQLKPVGKREMTAKEFLAGYSKWL